MKINKIINQFQENIDSDIEKSKNDGKEHGFLICDDNGKLHHEPLKGSYDIIAIGACKDGNPIGWFHTHPHREDAFPSEVDIINTKELGMGFFCIGTKNDLKCFETNISDENIENFEESPTVKFRNRLYEKTEVIYPEGNWKLEK